MICPHKRNAKYCRLRGMTLLEAVSVLVFTSILFSLAASILHTAFQSHRDAIRLVGVTQSLERLCQQFVSDVSSADQVSLSEKNITISRTQGVQSTEVAYAVTDQRMVRTVTIDGHLAANDMYALGKVASLRWSLDESERLPVVSMHVRFEEGAWLEPIVIKACAKQSLVTVGQADE